ncbi:hypothetical protein [Rubrivivax rivuli]|uniref:hypothetical protein n=1 Tax=Rubrivivax rivuli TaxID=1862385 RepID=UPI0013E3B818|nr:hypothetical protein [Rubrivivax rivuli]
MIGTLEAEAGEALRFILKTGTYPTKLAAVEEAVKREAERLRRRLAKGRCE